MLENQSKGTMGLAAEGAGRTQVPLRTAGRAETGQSDRRSRGPSDWDAAAAGRSASFPSDSWAGPWGHFLSLPVSSQGLLQGKCPSASHLGGASQEAAGNGQWWSLPPPPCTD